MPGFSATMYLRTVALRVLLPTLIDLLVATLIVTITYICAVVLTWLPSPSIGALAGHIQNAIVALGAIYAAVILVMAARRHHLVVTSTLRAEVRQPHMSSDP